jgi:hypothetical protein
MSLPALAVHAIGLPELEALTTYLWGAAGAEP